MKIDILVGIPSYNESDSISYVVEQVDKGLKQFFSDVKCQIVNVDNDSPDNTKEAFLKTQTYFEKIYISTPEGVKGKGNNFHNLFEYAGKVNADCVVVVDADLKSITPEWIRDLASPILKGKDFISPLYIRHKYDGTITNNLVFPLIYSLFNKYIRQPIGGDFAVSGELAKQYMKKEWKESTRQYGVDIFMTMTALVGDFSTDQVLLGAKIHKPSAPKLGKMFVQVVDTLFSMLVSSRKMIENRAESEKPRPSHILTEIIPPDISFDVDKIKKDSLSCFSKNVNFLRENFPKTLIDEMFEVFSGDDITLEMDLWSRIVFEFLNKYENLCLDGSEEEKRMDLIESLKPFYFARAYTFMCETSEVSSFDAEEFFLRQAETFWSNKNIFLEKSMLPEFVKEEIYD